MVRTINPVIAVLIGFAGFVVAMVLQFRAKRYNAWIYWLAVVMVAVFGTQAADVLHIKFHVPYAASTAFYAVVLTVIFVIWYRTEKTLSIHSIRTPRREFFYWATVLATFALGTATGDWTARTLNLGYLASGFLFLAVFVVVAVAHWKFGLNPILAFWICYVVTRPIGASFADYVAFPKSVGGLGVGHGPVALVLTLIIVVLVAYLAKTRIDVEEVVNAPVVSAPQSRGSHRRGPAQAAGDYRPPPRSWEQRSAEPRPEPGPRYPRPQDPPPRDPWPRDSGPRGPWPPDSGPRDPWPRDSGPRDSPPRDPWPQDRRPRNPGPRDPRPRDPWPREERMDPARPREGFFVWDDE
jgi:uncharacterized membrane-anchored protein